MNIMIKPVSGHCNIDCRYCFYKEGHTSGSLMSPETMAAVIDRLSLFLRGGYPLVFQGGEPLLAGHAFFENLFAYLASKELTPPILIQTNGTLLDDSFARLFAENNVLVGLSLDGTNVTHTLYRSGFQTAMTGIRHLREHHCEFNILTVVTDELCGHLSDIYDFYRREGFDYQQYIPCLAPSSVNPYQFLSEENYGDFLIELYNLWSKDIRNERYVSIRYFENLLQILAGFQPEECGAAGICSMQFVVESDGSVYPCDFYVDKSYCLGNLYTDSLEKIRERLSETHFISSSWLLPNECRQCRYLNFCRGGCKRYRNKSGKYIYCNAVRRFFEHALPEIQYWIKNKGKRP